MTQQRNNKPTRRAAGNADVKRARSTAQGSRYSVGQNTGSSSKRSSQTLPPNNLQSYSSQSRRNKPRHSRTSDRNGNTYSVQREMTARTISDYNQPKKKGGVFSAIGRGISSFFGFISSTFGSRAGTIAKIIIAVLLIGAVFFGIDAIRFNGKIFPKVSVGAVDVGGMTLEEAEKAIERYYSPLISSNSITIYSSEEAKTLVKSGVTNEETYADEVSLEDAHKNTLAWNRSATDLQAVIPSQALATEALSVGREDGGFLKRVGTMFFGSKVIAYGDYNKTALEALAMDIDSTIGEVRVDSSVEIANGTATSVAGHDGNMINRDELLARVNVAFLTENPDESQSSFIAVAEYSPQRITAQEAENAASRINSAIGNGAELEYQGFSWKVDKNTLGDWTTTEIIEDGSSYRLSVILDATKTQTDLLTKSTEISGEDALTVSFEKNSDGAVTVYPASNSGKMPNISQAKNELSTSLYGEDGLGKNASTSSHSVKMEQMDVPSSLSFDEAFEEGIIVLISTYTTEYSTGTEARTNRNFNIHLCAQLIDNSICKANGGKWNFNETTGECNEAAGFKNAGIIEQGVYTDAFGGGICQVATTVFNSVYEAGYPIPTRFNHTIYPESYPRGRDAAVDYGGYNLIWQNDSTSDVLLKTSFTETTVTVDLYGISPRLHVDTTVSDWEEGKEYGQTIYVDKNLPEGTDYIKKQGEDGGSLVTTRYVYDASNNLIRTDVFNSKYDPQNEVRIMGPGEESEALLKAKKAEILTDEIKAHL